MISIHLGNSYSKLTGLNKAQFDAIRRELSSEETDFGTGYLPKDRTHLLRERQGKVWYKDAKGIPRPLLDKKKRPYKSVQSVREAVERRARPFYRGYVIKRTSLLTKRCEFPSGLFKRLIGFLNAQGIPYHLEDQRKRPKSHPERFKANLEAQGVKLYPEQEEAIAIALERHRGTIEAATGFGKSILMVGLVAALKVIGRVLIVVPNVNLETQLRATFKKFFGDHPDIVIENTDSPLLQKDGNFDVLIVDESHHAACRTIRDLNRKVWKNIYFRYFVTGTPYRSREPEQLILESVIGEVIYRVPYQKAVERGYIVPVEAFFITVPKQKGGAGLSWREAYERFVTQNDIRNGLISDLIKNLHSNGQSVLTLVKEIEHGQAIQKLSGSAFAHGENPETPALLSWFADGKLKSLVATTQVAGEGTDTRACAWVIVAGLGKSRPQLVQQCGRGVRRFPGKEVCRVILFKDESNKYLLDHFQHQVKFLREEFGVTAVELDLPEGVAA